MTHTLPQPNSNIVPFPQQLTFTPLLKPISPSGQFNPTSDTTTSDGRPKAREAEPILAYSDYARMHAYLYKNNPRDAALFAIGIATGLLS